PFLLSRTLADLAFYLRFGRFLDGGLAALHGDGLFNHPQVFEPACFEPAEDFLVGMLGLIPGGVPVERVQDSPVAIGMVGHGDQVSESSTGGLTDERDFLENAV